MTRHLCIGIADNDPKGESSHGTQYWIEHRDSTNQILARTTYYLVDLMTGEDTEEQIKSRLGL